MSTRAWLLLSFVLYGLAMVLPCLSFAAQPTEFALQEIEAGVITGDSIGLGLVTMNGFELTFWGVIVLAFEVGAVGWFANPIYWGAALLFSRHRYKGAALVAGAAVVVGGFGTLLAFRYVLPAGSTPYLQLALQHLLVGFWLWLAAPASLAITAANRWFRIAE